MKPIVKPKIFIRIEWSETVQESYFIRDATEEEVTQVLSLAKKFSEGE